MTCHETNIRAMRKQLTGTGAIIRQIPLSKPKWEMTKITNRQNTMRTVGSYIPKGGHSATQTELKV